MKVDNLTNEQIKGIQVTVLEYERDRLARLMLTGDYQGAEYLFLQGIGRYLNERIKTLRSQT